MLACQVLEIPAKKELQNRDSVAELNQAELYLLRCVQKKSFSAEITALQRDKPVATSSTVRQLSPIIHDDLMCVGGRLENSSTETEKHPIIQPEHHVTELIIRDFHERNGHIGSNQTLATLRRKFYILRGYKQVKRVIGNCVNCRKHHGLPMQQLMGNLPKA